MIHFAIWRRFFSKLYNMKKVIINDHEKSGASSLKIRWVIISFVIWRQFCFWRPFCFPKHVICRRSIWATMQNLEFMAWKLSELWLVVWFSSHFVFWWPWGWKFSIFLMSKIIYNISILKNCIKSLPCVCIEHSGLPPGNRKKIKIFKNELNQKLRPPDFIWNQKNRIWPHFGPYFTEIVVKTIDYVSDIFLMIFLKCQNRSQKICFFEKKK